MVKNNNNKLSPGEGVKDTNTKEVDLIMLLKLFWEERKVIFLSIVLFSLLGLLVALFSQKEYSATTVMVPQIENPSAKLGGLSSLASLAGFNVNMNENSYSISPVLYPKIVSSVSFQLELMHKKYSFEELDKEISLFDYYQNYYKPGFIGILKMYTVGLPGLILKKVRRKNNLPDIENQAETLKISSEENDIRKVIDENLSLLVNEKEGYLKLESNFHQASLSAQVAKKAQELLQEYITNYKIEKAESQYFFIKDRYEEKKNEFQEAQNRLANFRDQNKNITSAVLKTKEESLVSEYQLSFDVYSELANQLEKSKIKIKEDTPVFSVIEEVVVPIKKSKPRRILILFVSVFLGLIGGMAIVTGRKLYSFVLQQWDEEKEV